MLNINYNCVLASLKGGLNRYHTAPLSDVRFDLRLFYLFYKICAGHARTFFFRDAINAARLG